MPDNTGRDARMKKEDIAVGGDNRKIIMDFLIRLMENASLTNDNTKDIGFVMPTVGDQPEKFVRLSDLERSFEDMALVHEIAINDSFSLKSTTPESDAIRYQLQSKMKDAYWDLLREQLSKDPPCFGMVIQLLLDIKETFKSLLKGNNDRALETILIVLDENNLHRLAEEHGIAVLEHNSQFVIKIMGMACSPARDSEIAALSKITEPIAKLRGIMEVLDNMKLDMANFVLESTRSEFVRYSVEYEKKKFEELQAFCGNRFPATTDWLKRNKPCSLAKPGTAEEAAGPSTNRGTKMVRLLDGSVLMPEYFIEPYLELLNPDLNHPCPELLKLDCDRLERMKEESLRLSICATIMQLTCACVPTLFNISIRRDLAANLDILIRDYPKRAELKDTLESLWLQVLVSIEKHFKESGSPNNESKKLALKAQILEIDGRQSAVYNVVWRKLITYMNYVIVKEQENEVAFPPCYLDYRDEIMKISYTFKKVIAHNFAVHGEYYQQIMQEL
ncbi:T-complex protein 11-like protein 1 [Anopheles nili]|uniref:T-complex protein 11-like protein 1 n=1 Tax=Anopheles nili TaxID=185578 RepID=UPI00237AFE7B|nr:T-complex protein 11-like protein 1 [Anopheles nili]